MRNIKKKKKLKKKLKKIIFIIYFSINLIKHFIKFPFCLVFIFNLISSAFNLFLLTFFKGKFFSSKGDFHDSYISIIFFV